MKAKLTIELFWLVAIVVLTGLIGLLIFGEKLFDPAPVDIQIYDTYYVFPKMFLSIGIFLALVISMWFARAIFSKLNRKIKW